MDGSIQQQIRKKIVRLPDGKLVFPGDFRELGSEAAIKMALSRLVKEGILDRVSHGIYYLPKIDPAIGKISPSMEEVANAIARRDKARIKPTGSYALHKLGLSTQMPMKLVYITDGAARQVKIGKRGIQFKATTAKKLSTKGEISSLVIQAFVELGQKKVTLDVINKVKPILLKEKIRLLKEDAKIAPAWIAEILFTIIKENYGTVASTN